MLALNSLSNYKNSGLLLLRIGLGIMMIIHGYPKIIAGPEAWASIGGSMSYIGINFLPTFWGFMAAFSETVGGLFFLIGFLYRPACILLAFTMFIAGYMHLAQDHGLSQASHALELMFVFLGLISIGPGKYSIDKK